MSRLSSLALAATLLVSGPARACRIGSGCARVERQGHNPLDHARRQRKCRRRRMGFAAVLDADGRRLLIDTGARADTVLKNAIELKVDLASITDLVITHNHGDHTGGLLVLRRDWRSRILRPSHACTYRRASSTRGRAPTAGKATACCHSRRHFEATGGVFVEHAGPVVLMPGVTMLGPIPRVHPERNWGAPRGGPAGRVQTPDGIVEDTVPEDTSLVVDTVDGLVLISGCGHAGIINTMEYARTAVRVAPVVAAIGGFHLFAASDDTLAWTAGKMKVLGVQYLLGAHCTGIEAVYRLRQLVGLTRATAAVAGVGATYATGAGIDPTVLAR